MTLGAGGLGLAGLEVANADYAAAAATGEAAWEVYYVDISQGATEVPIQAALNAAEAAGGGHVVVGPGAWTLSNYLRITANIRLTLTPNTVITRSASSSVQFMLINGSLYGTGNTTDDAITGYSGHGNIIVEGGVWDVNGPAPVSQDVGYEGMQFCHADGITVRDLEVRNVTNWHAIKFQGVTDGTIENCRFIGYTAGTSAATRTDSEAVSIDSCWASSTLDNTAVGQADHTTCVDIRIIGNYCDNGSGNADNFPVFAGGHNGEYNYWHHRIEISGNSVGNSTLFAIYAYNTDEVVITNNKIHDCFGGIRVFRDWSNDVQQSPNPAWDFVVGNNVLQNMTGDRGIEIYGGGLDTNVTPNAIAYSSRSTITGNLVDTAQKAGIHAYYAPDALITGNLVYNIQTNDDINGDGICIQNSTGANVTGNTIRTCTGSGVNFITSANALVSSNSISGATTAPVTVSTDSTNVVQNGNLSF